MTHKIIGITGQKRSGKDSIANVLVHEYGYTRVGLADPVKSVAMDLYGFTRDQVEGANGYDREQVVPGLGKSVRFVLQFIGTELARSVDPLTWIRLLQRKVDALPQGTRVVVPDVRFLNEAEAIRGMGGALWRVSRPGLLGVSDGHSSETELTSIDPGYLIVNDGDLDQLACYVREIIETVGAG